MGHAVVAVVNYDGRILLGKKLKTSSKMLAGKWHIPGESVESNESDEEALIRGMREEAGLEIKVGRYLGSSITPSSKNEAKWYECFSSTDNIIPGSDLEDAKFVQRNEVLNYCDERFKDYPKEIQDYFK